MKNLVTCFGCGGPVPDIEGPTHRYMESSPGCWAWYGEVLAKEYSNIQYASVHGLTVDAYAVQHPTNTSPQNIQSVAIHLMSLCAIFEMNMERHQAPKLLKELSQNKGKYERLSPPDSMGNITVADVYKAKNAPEHKQLVQDWAKSAWMAWSDHHATVKKWLSESNIM